MFTVSETQMEMLRVLRVQAFVGQITNYITSEYPEQCSRLGLDGTRVFVERSVEAAMRLGMETEGGIGGLIELRLLYGEDLEYAPERVWARNILAHLGLPDHIRIEMVRNRLSELTGRLVPVPHPVDP